MIKFAVIENRVDKSDNHLHRVESLGPLHDVTTTPLCEESIDSITENEKVVVVFNIKLDDEEGKALLRLVRNQQAKVCLYLSEDVENPFSPNCAMAAANWILYDSNQQNSLTEDFNKVFEQELAIAPTVTNKLIKFITQPQFKNWKHASSLTTRELEVMNLIAEGNLNKEIADKLGISLQTVKNHVKNIYPKMGASNRFEAIQRFVESSNEQVSPI
ncbi:MAG TPA: response regulator transcription factor [Williamwhitmania sp.]|nr:response regulator transcription factor [Williamwhitmania sp.]